MEGSRPNATDRRSARIGRPQLWAFGRVGVATAVLLILAGAVWPADDPPPDPNTVVTTTPDHSATTDPPPAHEEP